MSKVKVLGHTITAAEQGAFKWVTYSKKTKQSLEVRKVAFNNTR